jgi:hypothetical protein
MGRSLSSDGSAAFDIKSISTDSLMSEVQRRLKCAETGGKRLVLFGAMSCVETDTEKAPLVVERALRRLS